MLPLMFPMGGYRLCNTLSPSERARLAAGGQQQHAHDHEQLGAHDHEQTMSSSVSMTMSSSVSMTMRASWTRQTPRDMKRIWRV